MRLEEIMRKRVVTVCTRTTIGEALALLRGNRIRHLPVMENGKLVGIVSDRDLRDALPSTLCTHDDDNDILAKTVREIMRTEVITAHPLDFIEEAANLVYEHKVGSLPVVEGDQLVGIVTESDILNTLVELFGVNNPSSHLEVEVPDRVGVLAEVSEVFREAKTNVVSVMVFPSSTPEKKKIVFRVRTIDPRPVVERLESCGYTVIAPDKGGVHP